MKIMLMIFLFFLILVMGIKIFFHRTIYRKLSGACLVLAIAFGLIYKITDVGALLLVSKIALILFVVVFSVGMIINLFTKGK